MKKFLLLLFVGALACISISAQKTYNVTVPAGTKACYIAGNFASPTLNWGQIEMSKVDATHYTITISNATGAEGYKYCSGPNWNYVEKQADCSTNISDRTYSENDVVACWGAVYDPAAVKKDITVKVKSPWAPTYLYHWGDASNTWPGNVMTQVNGSAVWEYTISQVTSVSVIFNNGTGTQTQDINGVSSNKCYEVIGTTATEVSCDYLTILSYNENIYTQNNVSVKSENSGISVELNGDASMTVYSMQGSIVKSAEFRNNYRIDNLNSGLYLLKINGQSYKALVK